MTGRRAARPHLVVRAVWMLAMVLLGLQLVVSLGLAADRLVGREAVAITGGSMEPAFSRGDLVWLNIDATPHPGDIITFRSPTQDQGLVTHRVVSEGGGGYRTQGDANEFEDATTVAAGEVVGVVVSHIDQAGFTVMGLTSPTGRLVTYGPILVLILLDEVVGLGATMRARRRKDIDAAAPAA